MSNDGKIMLKELKIKLFADGADEKGIREFYSNPHISGFTTNPTLMRSAGIDDYERFAKNILIDITDKPLSFEVFSDDFADMHRQAKIIDSWGSNVYVKIPITNTKGESANELIADLLADGLKLNITAILTMEQVEELRPCFQIDSTAFISIFAGRIADTGRDPTDHIKNSLNLFKDCPKAETLWASCREVFNVFEADRIGCHIITVPHPILKKLISLTGKDLNDYSMDTVKMFYNDAMASGYNL